MTQKKKITKKQHLIVKDDSKDNPILKVKPKKHRSCSTHKFIPKKKEIKSESDDSEIHHDINPKRRKILLDEKRIDHDKRESTHEKIEILYDKKELLHDEKEITYDKKEITYDKKEKMHDRKKVSRDKKEKYVEKEVSLDEKEIGHSKKKVSHDEKRITHDEKKIVHDKKEKHDEKEKMHCKKEVSHDKKEISHDKKCHKAFSKEKEIPKAELTSISDDEDDYTSKISKAESENMVPKEETNKKKRMNVRPITRAISESDDEFQIIMHKEKNPNNKKNMKNKGVQPEKIIPEPIRKVKNEIKQMEITRKFYQKKTNEIPIHFNFSSNNEKPHDAFNKNVDLEKTMEELSSMISDMFKITKKIEIQYRDENGSYITIDQKMQVDDVKDEIKHIGKYGTVNELYIRIVNKKTSKVSPVKKENRNYYINIKDYRVYNEIGFGSFSKVYDVENIKTLEHFAAKVQINNSNDMEYTEKGKREIDILKLVHNHPRIINLYGISPIDFEGEENVTILMDLCTNGSLGSFLSKNRKLHLNLMTNTDKQIILVGIAIGMEYLHSKNVIHRDLKPDNILLDENKHPLITDFGMSKKYIKNVENTPGLGTPIYQAPETFNDNDNYNFKVDVYPFGLILYEVVTGKLPFSEDTRNHGLYRFFSRVTKGERPSIDEDCNPNLVDLMKLCWHNNPIERPPFSKIARLLAFNEKYYLDGVDSAKVISFANSNGLYKIK